MKNIKNILFVMGQGLADQHRSESAFTQELEEVPVTREAHATTDPSFSPDATIQNRFALKGKKFLKELTCRTIAWQHPPHA
ncbi:MAG: hypothetical protein HQL64_02925 [Magnetococcales bacterium]|nr:hypothetical protein [Magnetococcales bacterium]